MSKQSNRLQIYKNRFVASDHAVNTLAFFNCCSSGKRCLGGDTNPDESRHTVEIKVGFKWRTLALCDKCFSVKYQPLLDEKGKV